MQEGRRTTVNPKDGTTQFWKPDLKPINVKATVVMTISKRIELNVGEYEIDENGNIGVPYEELSRCVNDQVTFPTDLEGAEGWTVDDFFIQDDEAE